MITAEELRINNYVEINGRYIYMDRRIFHAVLHGFEGFDKINGIPLTEELLLKCGFIKKTGTPYTGKDKYYSFIWDAKDNHSLPSTFTVVFSKNRFFEYNSADELFYLHQLQNYAFVRTNEELNIQL